jgi:LysM repeat protein
MDTLHPGQQLLVKTKREPSPSVVKLSQLAPHLRSSDPASLSPSPGTPDGCRIHQVAARENLSTIALIYGMKVAELKRLNELSSDQLQEGQPLYVVGPVPASTPPRALSYRNRSKSVDYRKVLRVYDPAAADAFPEGTIPYIVGPDQTLSMIAELLGTSVSSPGDREASESAVSDWVWQGGRDSQFKRPFSA